MRKALHLNLFTRGRVKKKHSRLPPSSFVVVQYTTLWSIFRNMVWCPHSWKCIHGRKWPIDNLRCSVVTQVLGHLELQQLVGNCQNPTFFYSTLCPWTATCVILHFLVTLWQNSQRYVWTNFVIANKKLTIWGNTLYSTVAFVSVIKVVLLSCDYLVIKLYLVILCMLVIQSYLVIKQW